MKSTPNQSPRTRTGRNSQSFQLAWTITKGSPLLVRVSGTNFVYLASKVPLARPFLARASQRPSVPAKEVPGKYQGWFSAPAHPQAQDKHRHWLLLQVKSRVFNELSGAVHEFYKTRRLWAILAYSGSSPIVWMILEPVRVSVPATYPSTPFLLEKNMGRDERKETNW